MALELRPFSRVIPLRLEAEIDRLVEGALYEPDTWKGLHGKDVLVDDPRSWRNATPLGRAAAPQSSVMTDKKVKRDTDRRSTLDDGHGTPRLLDQYKQAGTQIEEEDGFFS